MRFLLRLIATLTVLGCLSLTAPARDFVVVIDPGHGGHDAGALGVKTNEKTVNLNVALKLGKLIADEHDDVKVVYTRKTDIYKTLQERADIANKAAGDLFISIHCNSLDKKNPKRRTYSGAATYTLGLHKSAANLAVAMRENSVMMLEDDFSETYHGFDPNSAESYIIFELCQNKDLDRSIDFAGRVQKQLSSHASRPDHGVRQAGFWVLARTSMPSVLVELDYICNPAVEQYMISENGQKKFAESIARAFNEYKRACDHSTTGGADARKSAPPRPTPAEAAPVEESADTPAGSPICYKVQFKASATPLPKSDKVFKGIKEYEHYKERGMYKYTTGSFSTMEEAQKELRKVRKTHSDAFIIKMRDGERIN